MILTPVLPKSEPRPEEDMIIIDTPFHITYSSDKARPKYACTDECKKSFWVGDFESDNKNECPTCGGSIWKAVEGGHYKVIKRKSGDAEGIQLFKLGILKESEVKSFDDYIKNGMKVNHLSLIKPRFEKYALEKWMSEGMNTNIETIP